MAAGLGCGWETIVAKFGVVELGGGCRRDARIESETATTVGMSGQGSVRGGGRRGAGREWTGFGESGCRCFGVGEWSGAWWDNFFCSNKPTQSAKTQRVQFAPQNSRKHLSLETEMSKLT